MNPKRDRQKEIKRCHIAAAESLSHPSPVHKVTSQPIAANPHWSSYPDAAEKRGSAAVKAFFSTSIFREQADAVTHREQVCVSVWQQQGCGVLPPMSVPKSKKLQLFWWGRGCLHTEYTALKVAEPGKCAALQKMILWQAPSFFPTDPEWPVRLALMLHIDTAVQPDPPVSVALSVVVSFLLLWQIEGLI